MNKTPHHLKSTPRRRREAPPFNKAKNPMPEERPRDLAAVFAARLILVVLLKSQ
jgi:hypothetical protein